MFCLLLSGLRGLSFQTWSLSVVCLCSAVPWSLVWRAGVSACWLAGQTCMTFLQGPFSSLLDAHGRAHCLEVRAWKSPSPWPSPQSNNATVIAMVTSYSLLNLIGCQSRRWVFTNSQPEKKMKIWWTHFIFLRAWWTIIKWKLSSFGLIQ